MICCKLKEQVKTLMLSFICQIDTKIYVYLSIFATIYGLMLDKYACLTIFPFNQTFYWLNDYFICWSIIWISWMIIFQLKINLKSVERLFFNSVKIIKSWKPPNDNRWTMYRTALSSDLSVWLFIPSYAAPASTSLQQAHNWSTAAWPVRLVDFLYLVHGSLKYIQSESVAPSLMFGLGSLSALGPIYVSMTRRRTFKCTRVLNML